MTSPPTENWALNLGKRCSENFQRWAARERGLLLLSLLLLLSFSPGPGIIGHSGARQGGERSGPLCVSDNREASGRLAPRLVVEGLVYLWSFIALNGCPRRRETRELKCSDASNRSRYA